MFANFILICKNRQLITKTLGRRSHLDQVDILAHHWRPIHELQLTVDYTVLKASTWPPPVEQNRPPLGKLKQKITGKEIAKPQPRPAECNVTLIVKTRGNGDTLYFTNQDGVSRNMLYNA